MWLYQYYGLDLCRCWEHSCFHAFLLLLNDVFCSYLFINWNYLKPHLKTYLNLSFAPKLTRMKDILLFYNHPLLLLNHKYKLHFEKFKRLNFLYVTLFLQLLHCQNLIIVYNVPRLCMHCYKMQLQNKKFFLIDFMCELKRFCTSLEAICKERLHELDLRIHLWCKIQVLYRWLLIFYR